ncbi:MAG: hypothetical protein KBT27_02820, partial [Prevotellaceae bacterium]|nr:hypothetical protein [Candidatus Faecinaster equi]
VILLGLFFVVDILLSRRIQSFDNYSYSTMTDIVHNRINPDLIILGSSCGLHAFDPHYLDTSLNMDTYNLSMDGYHFNFQYARYKLCMAHHVVPKYIIQEIDFESVLKYHSFKGEQFLPYFYDPAFRMHCIPIDYDIWDKYIPMKRYYGHSDLIKSVLWDSYWEHPAYKGYCGNDGVYDSKEYEAADSLFFTIDELNLKQQLAFLEETSSLGIKVIFVIVPIYSQMLKKVCNLQEMYTLYDSLASCYSVPLLDYSSLPLCEDTTYFFSATHLNIKGMNRFEPILISDLKTIIK